MGTSNKLYRMAIDTGKHPNQLILEAIDGAETLEAAAKQLDMSKQGLAWQLSKRGLPNPFRRDAERAVAGK